jgi:hypothetical protein
VQPVERTRLATPEEQAVLVKYTGWGWSGNNLNEKRQAARRVPVYWQEGYQKLKSLVTEDEWRLIEGSTLNAHYTAPEVIVHMWNAMRRLGFQGGRVLEPSAGIGHFIGLMPGVAEKAAIVAEHTRKQ